MAEKSRKKRVRHKTTYPGVFYYVSKRLGGKRTKTEKVYYYRFKKNGKVYEEKAGRQHADDMTAARAAGIRTERIEGKRLSAREVREKKAAEKHAIENIPTIDYLWKKYLEHKGGAEGWPNYVTDYGIYKNHLAPYFGHKQPHEILKLDISRAKKALQKKNAVKHGWKLALDAARKRDDPEAIRSVENKIRANKKTLSPQTIKHAFSLLRRLVNFGVDAQLCKGFKFKLKLDKVDNEKTEDLTTEQLKCLLTAIEEDTHPYAGKVMKLALYTGMRRAEMLRLRWVDIKFEREFIELRNDEGIRHTKGGEIETIPLNKPAAVLLDSIPKTRSKYVFPGSSGPKKDGRPGPRKEMNRAVNRIKKRAGLPEDFRPLHGLRHFYASSLASSGEVELYTLQKLLTHKDPKTTARYAHLRDKTKKKASALAGSIIEDAAKAEDRDDNKVMNLKSPK